MLGLSTTDQLLVLSDAKAAVCSASSVDIQAVQALSYLNDGIFLVSQSTVFIQLSLREFAIYQIAQSNLNLLGKWQVHKTVKITAASFCPGFTTRCFVATDDGLLLTADISEPGALYNSSIHVKISDCITSLESSSMGTLAAGFKSGRLSLFSMNPRTLELSHQHTISPEGTEEYSAATVKGSHREIDGSNQIHCLGWSPSASKLFVWKGNSVDLWQLSKKEVTSPTNYSKSTTLSLRKLRRIDKPSGHENPHNPIAVWVGETKLLHTSNKALVLADLENNELFVAGVKSQITSVVSSSSSNPPLAWVHDEDGIIQVLDMEHFKRQFKVDFDEKLSSFVDYSLTAEDSTPESSYVDTSVTSQESYGQSEFSNANTVGLGFKSHKDLPRINTLNNNTRDISLAAQDASRETVDLSYYLGDYSCSDFNNLSLESQEPERESPTLRRTNTRRHGIASPELFQSSNSIENPQLNTKFTRTASRKINSNLPQSLFPSTMQRLQSWACTEFDPTSMSREAFLLRSLLDPNSNIRDIYEVLPNILSTNNFVVRLLLHDISSEEILANKDILSDKLAHLLLLLHGCPSSSGKALDISSLGNDYIQQNIHLVAALMAFNNHHGDAVGLYLEYDYYLEAIIVSLLGDLDWRPILRKWAGYCELKREEAAHKYLSALIRELAKADMPLFENRGTGNVMDFALEPVGNEETRTWKHVERALSHKRSVKKLRRRPTEKRSQPSGNPTPPVPTDFQASHFDTDISSTMNSSLWRYISTSNHTNPVIPNYSRRYDKNGIRQPTVN